MGGHLHVLKALLGYEVPLLLVLSVVSLILLGPLLRHVGLALRGTTVLEDMGHGDAIDLPGTKVLPLRPGDFRQPFWLALQMLLGSRWAWRLLLPFPGRASDEEPVLSGEVLRELRAFFVETGDAFG
ncbi:unnamed protein product, partial [Symbiodinium microadriaticum]